MPLRMTADHYRGQAAYEPQRSNQGIVRFIGPTFAGMDWKILELAVRQFALPKMQDNVVEIKYLNETVKFAGSRTNDDLQLVFTSTVSGNVARLLNAWKAKIHDPRTGARSYAVDYKRDGEMILLDPTGNTANNRIFTLKGGWINQLDNGEIDYDSDAPVLINATFSFDKVIPPDQASFDLFQNLTNLVDGAQKVFKG